MRCVLSMIVAAGLLVGTVSMKEKFVPLAIEDSFLPASGGKVEAAFRAPLALIDENRGELGSLEILDDLGEAVPFSIEEAPEIEPERAALTMLSSRVSGEEAHFVFEVPQRPSKVPSAISVDLVGGTVDAVATAVFSSTADAKGAGRVVVAENAPVWRRQEGAVLEIGWDEAVSRSLEGRRMLHLILRRRGDGDHLALGGAAVFFRATSSAAAELFAGRVIESRVGPEESWLRVVVPAEGLMTEAILFGSDPTAGSREVTASVLDPLAGTGGYRVLAEGVVDFGARAPRVPELPVGARIIGKEILLSIRNGAEAPVLPRSVIFRARRPLVVLEHEKGRSYRVYYGEGESGASSAATVGRGLPRFRIPDEAVSVGAPERNPRAHAAPPLPSVGGVIDLKGFGRRKPITVDGGGLRSLRLDAEAVAGSRAGGEDLRIVEGTRQLPYIRVTSGPASEAIPVATRRLSGRFSSWTLALPAAHLPVTHITASASSSIFERSVKVVETRRDRTGRAVEISLGEEIMVRRGTEERPLLVIPLRAIPEEGALEVQVDNGDNAELELTNFKVHYPSTELLFLKTTDEPVWLYYGNPDARAPSYDLSLFSREILAMAKEPARLGAEEVLEPTPWWRSGLEGPVAFWGFWGFLGLVTLVLIVIVARLLPERTERNSGASDDSR